MANARPNTFYEGFLQGMKKSNNGPCLGTRTSDAVYTWTSYKQVLEKAMQLGSGMIELGQSPENSTHIGIYSKNREEFVLLELACSAFSMCVVPMYDTLGPNACAYILEQAELRMVFCDTEQATRNILKFYQQMPQLQTLVCMNNLTQDLKQLAQQAGVQLLKFDQVLEEGRRAMKPAKPASESDLFSICYTSGTTGDPKGVMVSHGNLYAVVQSFHENLDNIDFSPNDVMISYLPLQHIYEVTLEAFVYTTGARVGFYRGDPKMLLDDIKLLQPTLFPTVPRLLNKIYDKVTNDVSSRNFIARKVFNMALESKYRSLEQGVVSSSTVWDKLVFHRVQRSLGGRVRLISCGASAISPTVMQFIRAVSGAVVLEGYGQTECAAVALMQRLGEYTVGNVGYPISCCSVKLVDVPEMNYVAKQGVGEICVKGPNVFRGYLKLPNKTSETLDSSGWLHTGDIGSFNSDGSLSVIDRKKNIFKLAQGEYVAPEKIEGIYTQCPAAAQVFVHGDSLQFCTIAIVVLDEEQAPAWLQNKVGYKGTIQDACNNEDVKKVILNDFISRGKEAQLNSFEQVKAIYLHNEQFTVANDLMTPTFKFKRHEIKKKFKRELEMMYESIEN